MDHDPTAPSAIADKYHALAYDALPCQVSHPDHVAAVATMFGLECAPVSTARVLEVGCNDGSNLLPMAARLSGASFVGCDVAPLAIAAARETAAALALDNVRLLEADLASLGVEDGIAAGPFDYIIAHGVYSWVAAPIRDALFALVARTLAPRGIAFVSYNTYPGAFLRRAAWEALHWHTREIDAMALKLDAARDLAALMAEPHAMPGGADKVLQNEFKRIAGQSASELFHDTLGIPNDPVWFYSFVEHAARHNLAYVAEANPAMMAGGGLAAPVRDFLARHGRLAREQYLDIARSRPFRQSLLCRRDAASEFDIRASRLRGLAVSASTSLAHAASQARYPTLPGPDGEVLRRLIDALIEAAPATLPVADLVDRLRDASRPMGARAPEAILLDGWLAGFAQLHASPASPARFAGDTPRASAIARWQAARRDAVTNLRHETVRLPGAFARALLIACDGTRDRAALAQIGDVAAIEETLAMFARFALLERE